MSFGLIEVEFASLGGRPLQQTSLRRSEQNEKTNFDYLLDHNRTRRSIYAYGLYSRCSTSCGSSRNLQTSRLSAVSATLHRLGQNPRSSRYSASNVSNP